MVNLDDISTEILREALRQRDATPKPLFLQSPGTSLPPRDNAANAASGTNLPDTEDQRNEGAMRHPEPALDEIERQEIDEDVGMETEMESWKEEGRMRTKSVAQEFGEETRRRADASVPLHRNRRNSRSRSPRRDQSPISPRQYRSSRRKQSSRSPRHIRSSRSPHHRRRSSSSYEDDDEYHSSHYEGEHRRSQWSSSRYGHKRFRSRSPGRRSRSRSRHCSRYDDGGLPPSSHSPPEHAFGYGHSNNIFSHDRSSSNSYSEDERSRSRSQSAWIEGRHHRSGVYSVEDRAEREEAQFVTRREKLPTIVEASQDVVLPAGTITPQASVPMAHVTRERIIPPALNQIEFMAPPPLPLSNPSSTTVAPLDQILPPLLVAKLAAFEARLNGPSTSSNESNHALRHELDMLKQTLLSHTSGQPSQSNHVVDQEPGPKVAGSDNIQEVQKVVGVVQSGVYHPGIGRVISGADARAMQAVAQYDSQLGNGTLNLPKHNGEESLALLGFTTGASKPLQPGLSTANYFIGHASQLPSKDLCANRPILGTTRIQGPLSLIRKRQKRTHPVVRSNVLDQRVIAVQHTFCPTLQFFAQARSFMRGLWQVL
ncbi:hypothetical protein BT69DRAFT_161464 [Atractiella rhizophila]|nr:hypothetical protein BT69DRAFT_161464 [Atractiella rhizophila]